MEYRQLGNSGLRVSVLSLGTMTFGGGSVFSKVGAVDIEGGRHQVDLCIDAGVNLFDTANIYSHGASEEILGKALEGRRNNVIVATKARMVMHDGPNEGGASRHHIIRECEDSLRRLKTDWIDCTKCTNGTVKRLWKRLWRHSIHWFVQEKSATLAARTIPGGT